MIDDLVDGVADYKVRGQNVCSVKGCWVVAVRVQLLGNDLHGYRQNSLDVPARLGGE